MNPAQPSADRRAADVIRTCWLDGPPRRTQPPPWPGTPKSRPTRPLVLDLAFAEFLLREHKGSSSTLRRSAPVPGLPRLPRPDARPAVGWERRAELDAVLPGGLGQRTVNVDVQPVRHEGHPVPARRTEGPVASPPAPTRPGRRAESGGPARRTVAPTWPDAGARVGDFNLLRQLGKGAFGRVFLAVEEPTTQHVVVKVSKQRCDEAKVLGRLGHRNVVAVLSAPHDVASGLYLVVMPYLGSTTLEDLLEVAYPLQQARGRSARSRPT